MVIGSVSCSDGGLPGEWDLDRHGPLNYPFLWALPIFLDLVYCLLHVTRIPDMKEEEHTNSNVCRFEMITHIEIKESTYQR